MASLNMLINGDNSGFKKAMNEAMGLTDGLENKLLKLGEAFGLGFGVYKLIDFIKEATNETTKIAQEEGKIEILLKNQNSYHKEKIDFLKQQQAIYQNIGISALETAKAERLILERFPNANNAFVAQMLRESANFGAVQDISTAEAAQRIEQLSTLYAKTGKIPVRGTKFNAEESVALTKYGKTHHNINDLTMHFNNMLDKMYAREAQKKHDEDPFHAYKDAIIKLTPVIGKLGQALGNEFAPKLGEAINGITHWLKADGNMESVVKSTKIIANDLIKLAEFFVAKKLVTSLKAGFSYFKNIFKEVESNGTNITKPNMVLYANNVELVNGGLGGGKSGSSAIPGVTSGNKFSSILSKLAGPMIFAGMGLEMASEHMSGGALKTGTEYGSSILQGAGFGAMLGSAIAPGVGTAIGTTIGGVLGAIEKYSERTAYETERTADNIYRLGNTPGENQANFNARNQALESAKNAFPFFGGQKTLTTAQANNLEKFRAGQAQGIGFVKYGEISHMEHWGMDAHTHKVIDRAATETDSELNSRTMKTLNLTAAKYAELMSNTPLLNEIKRLEEDEKLDPYKAYNKAVASDAFAKPGTGGANSGQKGSNEATKVKGMESKQIIFNFNKDFINFTGTFQNVTEGAQEIVDIVTNAVLQGLQGAELMSQ